MGAQPETTTVSEERRSFNWRAFVLFPLVILIFYVLSAGPAVRLLRDTHRSRRLEFFQKMYYPVIWAYVNTSLQKPLGLYFHFWVPEQFDKAGDLQ